MKIRNTQLAAAAIALGEKLLPSTDFNCVDVTFDFPFSADLEQYEKQWRAYWEGQDPDSSPLAMMFKLSKARQWVLGQVVHGNHNSGLELPASVIEVTELSLACWLVANDHYLLKLDKGRRVFYFSPEAGSAIASFSDYARSYLKELDYLLRRIGSRNLARQKVHATIPVSQSVKPALRTTIYAH
jgi:hypothetical protein